MNTQRRRFPRIPINEKRPGNLYDKVQVSPLPFQYVDVSKQGVGLVATADIPVGEVFTLIMGDQTISLEVQWKMPLADGKNRYGCKITKPGLDLTDYFMHSEDHH